MRNKPFNPFYLVLLLAGTLFCVTACAYGVHAVVDLRGPAKSDSEKTPYDTPRGQAFAQWMDRYGNAAVAIELGVLAVATFAAIGTDDYWTRRFQRKQAQGLDSGETH